MIFFSLSAGSQFANHKSPKLKMLGKLNARLFTVLCSQHWVQKLLEAHVKLHGVIWDQARHNCLQAALDWFKTTYHTVLEVSARLLGAKQHFDKIEV